MGLQPKHPRGAARINTGFNPPGRLITASMNLAMVSAAERDSKFIADFAR
jgi:hypothetical protein